MVGVTIGQVLICFIALVTLWKDWKDFGELSKRFGKWVPVALAVATVVIAGLTVWQVSSDTRASEKRELESAKRDATNQGKTDQFQSTLTNLLNRISDLQKTVNTEPLLKQNDKLIKEVDATRKEVQAAKAQLEKPAEKATLEATMGNTLEEINKKEVAAQLGLDGSVEFTILVVDISNVQAKNGSLFIRICLSCAFAKEPERFVKPVGSLESDREMPFQVINASTSIGIPLKIKPPPFTHRFQINITPRCENCLVQPPQALFVNY